MKSTKSISRLVLFGALAVVVALAAAPPVPKTPAAVDELISAQRFELTQGYEFTWRAEKPQVRSGYVLVLKVNPDLVYPRQTAEPVLYVGNQTAERVNMGYESGRVIAIVPGDFDLTKTPIWFGKPDLPERVTAQVIERERAAADKAGIKAFAAEKVKAALGKDAKPLTFADRDGLRAHAAELIKQHSPQESDLANGLLVPRDKE